MDKLKLLTTNFLLITCLLLLNGCGSTGAILYDQDTESAIQSYIADTRPWVETEGGHLKVVFHRAGSFQEYAKNVNDPKFKYGSGCTSVKDVAVLMDRSFEELAADGVEIDAQTVPANEHYPNVYIVHDKIKPGQQPELARSYLINNTLTEVLTHFIRQQYFRPQATSPSGRYLYIELKISKKKFYLNHSPLSQEQKGYIEQIIRELQTAIESATDTAVMGTAVRRQVGFASFNPYALEYAHEFALKNNQSGYAYNFIAGTNRGLLGYLANIFGSKEINYLNAQLTQKLKLSKRITGIWFDPAGINRIANTFNTINRERESPLSIYISTYKLDRPSYLKRLRKGAEAESNSQPVKLKHVRGLIFDIQACKTGSKEF